MTPHVIIAALVLTPIPSMAQETQTVIVGRLLTMEEKTRNDLEGEKSRYGHDNAQYLAVEIVRVVVGMESHRTVIVRVNVDASGLGIEWLTANYGILTPTVWRTGRGVVLFLSGHGSERKQGCPGPWYPREGSAEDAEDQRFGKLLGYKTATQFEPFRGAPVYCMSVKDVLLLAE